MTHAEAEAVAAVWERLGDANPFARAYTEICEAMRNTGDADEFILGVQTLTRGLPGDFRDLTEMIVETGRALPTAAPSDNNVAGVDPLTWLASELSKRRSDDAD